MAKETGLKYHKFLKNFLLFFIAALNCISAALYFSGVMYSWSGDPSVNATVIYSVLGKELKTLDIVYACLLGLGTVIAITARHRLAKGFKDGVSTTCGLLVFEGILPFVYSVWGHMIVKEASIINLKDVIFCAIYVSIAILTFKYYKKREELFKD